MFELFRRDLGGRVVVVGATDRDDADMHPDDPDTDLRTRQQSLVGGTWVMLDQRHGAEVYTLDALADVPWPLAAPGDVLVAPADVTMPIAVWTADCAPLALVGRDGTRVLAHAGWRGLSAGVVGTAVEAVDEVAVAVLGPSIHPCCYEFGSDDLAAVASSLGLDVDAICATTSWGVTALDVPGVVAGVLRHHGIALDVIGPCTGCEDRWYSHRRRADTARHAVVSWFEETT